MTSLARILSAALAAALAACTAEAPQAPAGQPEALRGALRGPAMAAAATLPDVAAEVTVYPSSDAKTGRPAAPTAIEHERSGDPAEIIFMSYGQAGDRHRVRLGDDFVWMASAQGLRFQTPAAFWTGVMPYLNVWNGALSDSPGGPPRPSLAAARIEPPDWVHDTAIRIKDQRDLMAAMPAGWTPMDAPVRVIGAELLNDELWLQIELIDADACGQPEGQAPVVYDRGWVRQRAAAPFAVIAHYPHGC